MATIYKSYIAYKSSRAMDVELYTGAADIKIFKTLGEAVVFCEDKDFWRVEKEVCGPYGENRKLTHCAGNVEFKGAVV